MISATRPPQGLGAILVGTNTASLRRATLNGLPCERVALQTCCFPKQQDGDVDDGDDGGDGGSNGDTNDSSRHLMNPLNDASHMGRPRERIALAEPS